MYKKNLQWKDENMATEYLTTEQICIFQDAFNRWVEKAYIYFHSKAIHFMEYW